MKKLIVLGLIFLLLIGCTQEKQLNLVVEDLNEEVFGPGIYYQFENNNNIGAELILNSLIEDGFALEEAWYKPFASSCCPPNTNRCMQAVVEPVFLIRLTEEIELENFVRVEDPDIGWCAYTVQHYELK